MTDSIQRDQLPSSNRHVCMLLRGDFTNNLRVRKQAQTLVRNGWQVTVIALALRGQNVGAESDPDGFVIRRVSDNLPVWKTLWRGVRTTGEPKQAPGTTSGSDADMRSSRKSFPLPVKLLRLILNRVAVMFRMAGAIRDCRPTLIECHNVNTLPAGFLGLLLTGAPVVYDAHEINTQREGYYARIKWLIWLVERLLVPRSVLVMSTTDMRVEHYQNTYRLRERPLVIQNKPRYVEVESSGRLRRALDIPPDAPVVLYQGGLQEGRGLHNLVRVAARVQEAVFVFLGNGSQEASLRALAGSLRVAGRVYFHPAVPLNDLPHYTADADIGMQILRNTCLNHYTTDSNKIFEYGMAGLAVVASNFPEIRRIVEQFEYGVLVDPDNIDEVANAVRRLATDKAYCRRLQENARRNRRALSWESQEEVYLSAMNHAAVEPFRAAAR